MKKVDKSKIYRMLGFIPAIYLIIVWYFWKERLLDTIIIWCPSSIGIILGEMLRKNKRPTKLFAFFIFLFLIIPIGLLIYVYHSEGEYSNFVGANALILIVMEPIVFCLLYKPEDESDHNRVGTKE